MNLIDSVSLENTAVGGFQFLRVEHHPLQRIAILKIEDVKIVGLILQRLRQILQMADRLTVDPLKDECARILIAHVIHVW